MKQPLFYTVFLLITIALSLTSCKKDQTQGQPETDYRDEIVGDYSGIRVYTNLGITPNIIDTTHNAIVTIEKSTLNDSSVIVSFDPPYTYSSVSMKYSNGTFPTSGIGSHPPTLTKTGDSLYYYHRPAQSPVWFEYFVVKVP